ncbi:Short-chain dehydrogenase [Seminavis robusta]|uniref:Short-chain dehydrogenase n=1 Tax=Seminavis robusta TaxID=568900 RepID=A0A9N8F027_9STRA|nr:Short-chain dehydrogenase [Seminavis robusta]|eukprot:Sro2306_g322700.1 Short-chain dehydrogenase (324) ;mRNA; r:814-1785
MISAAPKSVLITGANSGLGLECARQLALLNVERIVIGCRSEAKGKQAQEDLKQAMAKAGNSSNKTKFEVLLMDLSDIPSVKKAVATLATPVESLVMNAGGLGGGNPGNLTKNGVSMTVATNLLGHVVLFDGLVQANKLTKSAIYAGSEAARGEWRMMLPSTKVKSGSKQEFQSMCDGSFYGNKSQDLSITYAGTKFLAALWVGAVARAHPNLRVVTVSPGHTAGTGIFEPEGLPNVAKFLMKNLVLPLQYLFGMAQSKETSAKRYVDVLCDSTGTTYPSGTFFASKRGLTGPIADQSTYYNKVFSNQTYQDNASDAIHSFIDV